MPDRPYTILSCSISLDGYLDGATQERWCCRTRPTSSGWTRSAPTATRSSSGPRRCATTTRGCWSATPRAASSGGRAGLGESPTKVTVTERAQLDACSNFFATGDSEKLVYCASRSLPEARRRLAAVATVVDGGQPVDVAQLAEDLHDRGVRRLMVEGGGQVHTQFLTTGLADELHLVVAPFFVGTSRARRFVGDGAFPWNPGHRAQLAETRQIGDVVLLRYALSSRSTRPLERSTVPPRVTAATVRREVRLRASDGSLTQARCSPSTGSATAGARRARARRPCGDRTGTASRRVSRWCGCTASA